MAARVALLTVCAWAALGAAGLQAQTPRTRASPAQAPSHPVRPLVTVDPAFGASGWAVVETGTAFFHDREIPATGLRGDVLRVPELSLRLGVGRRVELRIDTGYDVLFVRERREGPLANELDFDGESSSDIRDPVVATLVRLRDETAGGPALGLRIATRLPVASNQSGLGLDTTDFFASLLAAKDAGAYRWIANLGLGILEVPTTVTSQNDVVTYGLSLTRRIGERVTLVAGVDGHVDPSGRVHPGTEDTGILRFGTRITRGTSSFDAALLVGLAEVDSPVAFTVGVTRAFRVLDGT